MFYRSRILLSIFILFFNICTVIQSQPNRKRQPSKRDSSGDDPLASLQEVCGGDLQKLCDNEIATTAKLSCLYDHQNDISSLCYKFLSVTTQGGCNLDAQRFCSTLTSVDDISNCLNDQMESLSINCYRNLHNYNTNLTEDQERMHRITAVVSILGILLLSMPVALVIAMYNRLRDMESLDEEVLKTTPSQLLPLSLPTVTRDLDKSSGEFSLDLGENCSDDNLSSEEVDKGARSDGWCISFHELSYYAFETVSVWQPWQTKPKPILNKISGQLSAGKVTAIMGPSGSGKTTLLKLLGGQMFVGEFQGIRAINEQVPKKVIYDQLMRQQGFVHQYDGFVSTLTVWETLKYSALLRLPASMTMKQKLCRAAHIMHIVDISHIAQNNIGNLTSSSIFGSGNQSMKGISGGQRRRLAMALEILPDPAIILLDEPTSGLDGASTLKIVSTLREVSRKNHTTIGFTIHQPRAEVFELFDSLILLGTGGFLVYAGPTHHAAAILSTAPALSTRGPIQYENPADFIIDCLGLTEENSIAPNPTEIGRNRNTSGIHSPIFVNTTITDDEEEKQMLIDTSLDMTEQNDAADVDRCASHLSNNDRSVRRKEVEVQITEQLADYFRSTEAYALLLSNLQHIHTPVDSNNSSGIELRSLHTSQSSSSNLTVKTTYPTIFWEQVAILFARRKSAFGPDRKTACIHILQIFVVSAIVTAAFSYQVDSPLLLPYQVLMIISLICLYAMVLQYLHILPIYLWERPSLISDTLSGYVSNARYVMAATLTEVPIALIQCTVLLIAMYSIHHMNPNRINRLFTVVCLMIGVVAFQGMLTICSVITDSMEIAYSITFMVLSSGTIFGGFLIPFKNILPPFHFVYFTAVSAITQRALVINDLSCCYLTTTCNEYVQFITMASSSPSSTRIDYSNYRNHLPAAGANLINTKTSSNTTYVCPSILQFNGDGSDVGNLGEAYSMALDLPMNKPFAALSALLVANILFRCISYGILQYRLKRKDCLRER